MQVILLENVGKLGGLGDQVNVKPGYGRNFLIPKGKAVSATKVNVEKFEARRAEYEKAAAETKGAAEARAVELGKLEITIPCKAGEEGKLFGSISNGEIASAVVAAGAALERNEVRMPNGPLRVLGEHQIECHLHSDVNAMVKVTLVAE